VDEVDGTGVVEHAAMMSDSMSEKWRAALGWA
jgi:hypothetical protein